MGNQQSVSTQPPLRITLYLLASSSLPKYFVNELFVTYLLYVSRPVIYKWVKQFQERSALDIRARVSDGIRSGRPRTVHGVIDQLIGEVIDLDPRDLGYRPSMWTASLLAVYPDQVHHIKASPQSIRLAIERLRIRWKRPRHCLSERPATWRQAKGGLNAD